MVPIVLTTMKIPKTISVNTFKVKKNSIRPPGAVSQDTRRSLTGRRIPDFADNVPPVPVPDTLVERGHTVFIVSWKHPEAVDRDLVLAD